MTTAVNSGSIANAITYKAGWQLHVRPDGHKVYLQWQFPETCVKTGAPIQQTGRKWYLSSWMTESEIVQTAFLAALTAEEHECREHFYYHGKRVFGPHISVRALMEACEKEEHRT